DEAQIGSSLKTQRICRRFSPKEHLCRLRDTKTLSYFNARCELSGLWFPTEPFNRPKILCTTTVLCPSTSFSPTFAYPLLYESFNCFLSNSKV
ncbi:MAG: hypothetical protein ACYS80_15720, partial [Planctomycetota bacterium]